MQPNITVQGHTGEKNRSFGDNVPARLGYEPCWTNAGKDENELGTFLHKHLLTIKRGKVCGTVNWFSLYVQQGIARNLWGVAKGKRSYTADTEQTYPVITSTILT